jgi:hypothetical protein
MGNRSLSLPLTAVSALFFLIPLSVSAAAFPSYATSPLFEASQAYSVVLRGNGEAVTYALLTIPNTSGNLLQSLDITTHGSLDNLAAYQQVVSRTTPYPVMENGIKPTESQSYPYYSQPEYQKVAATFNGAGYSLALTTPIEAQQSLQLVLSYSSMRYVKDFLGLHTFSFPTVGIPLRSQTVTINIDVDSDLYLRDKKSSVNYGNQLSPPSSVSAPSAHGTSQINAMPQKIGYASGIQKQFSEVAPGETATVRGDYAASWLRLYLGTVIEILLLVATVLIGLWYLFQKLSPASRKSLQNDSIHVIAMTSFVSVALAVSSVIGILVTEDAFGHNYGYSHYAPLLFNLIGFLLISLFLIAPPLYLAIAKSPKTGFYTFVSEIALLFAASVIGLGVVFTYLSASREIMLQAPPIGGASILKSDTSPVLPK